MFLFEKTFNQKSTALILTICIIGSTIMPVLLYPKQANAAISVVDIPHTVLQAIWKVLTIIWQAAMKYYNAIQAYIAQWMKSKTILTWLVGVLLNLFLHQILAQLTNDIVNWIQNGTTPRFLTMGLDDWLDMAADNVIGNFIDQYLGIGWLCEPFDIDIKIALLDQPTFKEEVRCSLSDIVENIEDFYNDFSTGGWRGWIKLTEGSNNVYGAYLITLEEKNRIIGIENKEQETDIARSSGFFSPKDCIWFDDNDKPIDLQIDSNGRRYTSGYQDVWGSPSYPEKCEPDPLAEPFVTMGFHDDGTPIVGPCYPKCTTHTPGKQISDAVSDTLGGYRNTINELIGAAAAKAGPLSIYVQAILTALINRVFKEGYGLLFAQDESIPSKGDLGGAGDIPEIFDPTEIAQDKTAIGLLETTLPLLKDSLDKLLIEQETNLEILDQILIEYESASTTLDQILDPVNNCDSAAKSWATSQKLIVDAEIIKVKGEITAMENDIKGTESAINRIATITADIATYYEKYSDWETVYNTYGGEYDPDDPNDPVTKAFTDLDDVKKKIIEEIQLLLTDINGSYTGTTLSALEQEINDTYVYISNTLIPALKDERGDQASPESGTLYDRLRIANELKLEADTKLGTCSNY